MKHKGTLLFPAALAALVALAAAQEQREPGPVEADVFHPATEVETEPAYGGRVIIHLSTMPQHVQKHTENSAVVTWMYNCIHDKLAFQDWEGWHMEPRLATRWDTEDTLVLKEGAAAKYGQAAITQGEGERERQVIYGNLGEEDDAWVVGGLSAGNPAGGEGVRVAKSDVASVELGTVFTFYLRQGVVWHDGHPFDAQDVYFSWEAFQNPYVDCDEIRHYYEKMIDAEVVDDHTVRIFYEEQYFLAEQSVCEMPLIASHIYDLRDPDCEDHKSGHGYTDEELGENINDNDANNNWIGLGPYRVTHYDPSQYIEAERFAGYYDADSPVYGGYFDAIRWRYIKDDNAAMQALLNGELDYFDRVKSEDYFGQATAQDAFTEHYYKGYFYTGTWGYTGWNMRRPQFRDLAVRKALAHAFDLENWRKTKYKGLAKLVSGPVNFFAPGYDRDVEILAYDPDLAEELLAEAGWYDRDGDGIADKDGIPLEIEFLYPSGNEASSSFGIAYQEALGELGIKLNLRNLEWATYLERLLDRDFDAMNMAWVPPLESDPEQIWHSKHAGPRTSNFYGIQDAEVDRLIEAGQRELDLQKRSEIWKQFHARVYELQPCLFMMNSPRKFAMNKNIRGMQTFQIAPGYDPRRWYYPKGTPGTRDTREKQ